jgi:hypothetical protein
VLAMDKRLALSFLVAVEMINIRMRRKKPHNPVKLIHEITE